MSRYGLQIRSAAPSDAQGVAEILTASGRSVDSILVSRRLEALAGRSGAVLLAEAWGPPAGLIVLQWFVDVLAPEKDPSGLSAIVSLLFVAEDQRRLGVGRLLLKAGSQAARAAGCARVWIAPPTLTPELERFCRSTGFEDAGALLVRSLRKTPGQGSPRGAAAAGV